MKYLKRILSVLLAVLLMAGCTAQETSVSKESDVSSSTEAAADPTDEPVSSEVSSVDESTTEPTPDPTPTPTPTPEPEPEDLFDSYFDSYTIEEKLAVLRERFPDGMYWNHSGLDIGELSHDEAALVCTDTPCDHSSYGYGSCNIYNGETMYWFGYSYNTQCLGFASLVSDFLFGKDIPINSYTSFDEIRVGDHIRLDLWDHSFIVTEVGINEEGEDYIKVLECNRNYEDCLIEWDRVLTRSDMASYGPYVTYLTRYLAEGELLVEEILE